MPLLNLNEMTSTGDSRNSIVILREIEERDSWQLLKHLSTINNLPWLLMGNFNDLHSQDEKKGRHMYPHWLCKGFNEVIESNGLQDLEFDGSQFTWEKSRGTQD